jgi:hypothetical protein
MHNVPCQPLHILSESVSQSVRLGIEPHILAVVKTDAVLFVMGRLP